jgi:glutaredoxin-related protein
VRPLLDNPRVDPKAAVAMGEFHRAFLDEVRAVIDREPLVVIGMKWNTVVKKLRRSLDAAGIRYTYLEYGSYVSMWKPRLAIKLWSGWPTFPQVYAHGVLLGGRRETEPLIADGSLARRLGSKTTRAA